MAYGQFHDKKIKQLWDIVKIQWIHFRWKNDSYFSFEQMYRQPRYRETIQMQAYNLDNFIGNVGGYMGLFLGYAFVQLPNLFESGYITTTSMASKMMEIARSRGQKFWICFNNNHVNLLRWTWISLIIR